MLKYAKFPCKWIVVKYKTFVVKNMERSN